MKICFVTGGTGGHIYPALALADKMKELDSSTEILFIGNDDRMEKDLIPQTAASSVPFLKMVQWFRFPFPAMMRIHMILFTTMEFSILKYCEICDIRAETTVIWTLI